jgi:superfamily II DNA or RNA helicase
MTQEVEIMDPLYGIEELYSHGISIQEVADVVQMKLKALPEVTMEMVSKIKGIVQDEAETAWMIEKWGYITAATGVGKSKMAINIIEKCVRLFLDRGETPVVLLSVPTENLRDSNWPDELRKWNAEWLLEYMEPICYKSLPTISGRKFHLVVLDEWHNITELNSTFFWQNEVKALLGLSATKPRDLIKLEIAARLQFTEVYKITLDTAIKLHLVVPYEITVVNVKLDKVDKYVPTGKKTNPFLSTEQRRYDYLTQKIEEIKRDSKYRQDEHGNWIAPTITTARARGMIKNLALQRMRLIYTLKTKLQAAAHILSLFGDDERIITFCGSIDHADALSGPEGHTFHSKLKGKKKAQWLEAFKAEEINRITCVNSLNEGENVNNVDIGLIVQLNSNELHTIQRIGRTVRYRPNHIAQIIIICVEGTKDEEWVYDATASLETSNIRRISYEELVNGTVTL